MATSKTEHLACEFFREFSRYEYCLKAAGLREDARGAKASWEKYAAEVTRVIDAPQSKDVVDAIDYFIVNPPKKQIINDGALDWDKTLPDHKNKAELVFLLICRVRNNLFHGGKFNGRWFEPQRSEELLKHALVILRECAKNHPGVREAYSGSVSRG